MKKIVSTLILGIIISLTILVTPTYSANTCWWGFTCNQGDPANIPYCPSGGDCTIQKGADQVSAVVGPLFSKKTISAFVSDTVRYFLSFVSLIAVVYFLYAGFQLMTSGGDEEKAKKTKKIMIYVIAGILLMWVSYWLVAIVIGVLN